MDIIEFVLLLLRYVFIRLRVAIIVLVLEAGPTEKKSQQQQQNGDDENGKMSRDKYIDTYLAVKCARWSRKSGTRTRLGQYTACCVRSIDHAISFNLILFGVCDVHRCVNKIDKLQCN